jgi:hypothetical protein
MLNSLATITALGFPAFVYCFDQMAVRTCQEYGIPHFQADAARMFDAADFRQDRKQFLDMGVHKPEMVQKLFSGAPQTSCGKLVGQLMQRRVRRLCSSGGKIASARNACQVCCSATQ